MLLKFYARILFPTHKTQFARSQLCPLSGELTLTFPIGGFHGGKTLYANITFALLEFAVAHAPNPADSGACCGGEHWQNASLRHHLTIEEARHDLFVNIPETKNE